MKLFLAALLCAAFPLFAQELRFTIIDRYDDVKMLPSTCVPGAKLRWTQESIVDRAEKGAHVYVTGMDSRLNGLYRITEYSKIRTIAREYRVTFTAECVAR